MLQAFSCAVQGTVSFFLDETIKPEITPQVIEDLKTKKVVI